MATYKTKERIITAEQFNGTNLLRGMDWDMGGAFVVTIHGNKAYCMPLDYIIPEPDGIHYYRCKR